MHIFPPIISQFLLILNYKKLFLFFQDTFINENVTEMEGGFMCNPCDKMLTTRGGIARHVEDLHVNAGVRFQCPKCPYIAKNKNCLQSHVSRRHPGTQGLNYDQYALYRTD